MLLVPWLVFIDPSRRDPQLGNKLKLEASGILNRLLDGLCDWLDNALVIPASVADATAQYRSNSDPLGRFLSDCTRMKAGGRVRSTEVYGVYVAWAKANGETIWTNKGFAEAMREKGIAKKKSDTVHWLEIELTRTVEELERLAASASEEPNEEEDEPSRPSRNWEDEQ